MAEENKIILDADVKPLKAQLKEATIELQNARAKFGDLSSEAVEAAKKVAGIRDSIEGANEQAQLFDPGKRFQALTNAASLAAGAVGAVQGAMGLFGAESEDVQKALLKVQSAMALSQGLSQLKDLSKVTDELKSSFKGLVGTTAQKVTATASDTAAVAANSAATKGQSIATLASSAATKAATISLKIMRGALIGLGIPALIIGLVALVQNFDKIKSVVLNFIPGLGQLADFFGNLVTKITDFVGITSQANRELEKLTKTTSRSNEDITARINLLTAQGGKEKEIFELKKKQSENELNVLRATLKTKGSLTAEESKQFRDLKNEQQVEQAAYDKKVADDLKAANEKQASEAKSAADKAKANQEQVNAKKLEAQKIFTDAQNSLLTEREQQAAAIEATFQEQSKKLKQAGIKDDGTLEEVRRKGLAEIDKKFNDEKAEKDKAFQDRLNEILTESRLAGIKDQNERERAELLVQQEQKLADLATDTTLEADQKLALQKQLEIRNKQELDALEKSFAEEKLLKDLEELDAEAAKITTTFERQREIVAEQEKINLELKGKTEKERTAIVEAAAEERKAIDMAELAAKTEIQNQYFNLAGQFGKVMQEFAGKNKKLAIAGVIVEQSAAIGNIISNTAMANAKAVSATPLTGGLPFTAINTISAGLSIASTIRGAVKAIQGINGASSITNGGIQAPAGISASAPSVGASVPTIGTSPVTALGTMMQNQPPLRAFVVESEVTNSQKRVADIERRAGF